MHSRWAAEREVQFLFRFLPIFEFRASGAITTVHSPPANNCPRILTPNTGLPVHSRNPAPSILPGPADWLGCLGVGVPPTIAIGGADRRGQPLVLYQRNPKPHCLLRLIRFLELPSATWAWQTMTMTAINIICRRRSQSQFGFDECFVLRCQALNTCSIVPFQVGIIIALDSKKKRFHLRCLCGPNECPKRPKPTQPSCTLY